MTWLIAASILVLLVVGSLIALWWWRLVAKMAPYQDEVERQKGHGAAPEHPEVEIISRSGPKQE